MMTSSPASRFRLLSLAAVLVACLSLLANAQAPETPAASLPHEGEAPINGAAENEAPVQYAQPFLIRFEGPITQMRTQYLLRSLEKAKTAGADLIVGDYRQQTQLLELLGIGNA